MDDAAFEELKESVREMKEMMSDQPLSEQIDAVLDAQSDDYDSIPVKLAELIEWKRAAAALEAERDKKQADAVDWHNEAIDRAHRVQEFEAVIQEITGEMMREALYHGMRAKRVLSWVKRLHALTPKGE